MVKSTVYMNFHKSVPVICFSPFAINMVVLLHFHCTSTVKPNSSSNLNPLYNALYNSLYIVAIYGMIQ